MRGPFCSVIGGEDKENTTTLSPGTASNISGAPDGARYVDIVVAMHIEIKAVNFELAFFLS